MPSDGPAERCETIRFSLNGDPVEVAGLAATTTLLDWLRYARGLTGSKQGCAEGDCGACTVGLRSRRADGSIDLRPVNACIQLLPMLHGREVVTVEGLSEPATRAPHPVQSAISEGHGSQCGFCTPGIVMALWAEHGRPAADRAPTADLLSGNLCRCTGYGPILEAADRAFAEPPPAWDDAGGAPRRIAALGADGDLAYSAEGRRFWAPTSLSALLDLAAEHPDATLLAGATDVGLWVTKNDFDPEKLIWIGRVNALKDVRDEGDAIWIGAGATYSEAWRALADLAPEMGELIRRIGGAQVRASGTVGGNIANGSPIGDSPPALIALGATLVLRSVSGRRETPLEDFFIAYGRQDLRPGEIVEGVRIPKPDALMRVRFWKISKRFDQDITGVLGCFAIRIQDGSVASVRIAFGGMAATPKRAAACEAALLGAPWTEATVEAAARAMAQDFAPIDDHRASAAYRQRVAQNLVRKLWLEEASPDAASHVLEAAVR